MRVIDTSGLRSFRIPLGGEAGTPVELQHDGGRLGSDARADVRLMVARSAAGDAGISHRRFAELPDALTPGDLLVVNTSAVIPAALEARGDGDGLRLHLSTELPGGFWVVEPRRPAGPGTERYDRGSPPAHLVLPGGGRAELLAPYPAGTAHRRLW
ncbi:MAG TPA: S-adenosylmethionine:tRNA ribosyltransferase-isomerase, partial [Acidimicrobiales bacterium]|nr:S-adenosylmethionine:tRNA ribosyltransferase-isomerase [Acidimicrobiales bacterium]